MTSTGAPPSLRPRWSSASSNEFRMSLPMTAVGPEKVETKPILIGFWALATPTDSASTAALKNRVLRIVSSQVLAAQAVGLLALCGREGATLTGLAAT